MTLTLAKLLMEERPGDRRILLATARAWPHLYTAEASLETAKHAEASLAGPDSTG
jgi:hypothetical protein